MSPCLTWRYFLKKLGIRRKRTLCAVADTSTAAPGGERQRENSPEMADLMLQVRQMHENNKYDVSLLHPNWRRFPHAPLYGWTNDHAQQLKSLNDMIINGSLESAYYNSDVEYRAAYFVNHYAILPPPNVSDINEAVLLLRRNQGFHNNSCCNESLIEYDADDESENNPRLQRYYNHHRPRRLVGQRTVV